jgi:aryl-alcohol dehydrogenase-like predicted oxidoreductase
VNTRKLGWTDLNLTNIGIGTWAIGGDGAFGWGYQDDAESIAVICHAIEKGVNWIDTAPIYGLGHSEEVVGIALKRITEKPIIATKCGIAWDKNGKTFRRLSGTTIRKEVEDSLRRLGIDAIDLYQIHRPDPEAAIEEAWEQIANMIKEGKIRYAGVSNFNIEQVKRAQAIYPVASVQPPYSIIERSAEDSGLLEYCHTNNIGVIVYSPMQKGLLSGKYSKKRITELPKNDHRRNDPNFKEPRLSSNLQLIEQLVALAKKRGRTSSRMAISWVLRLPYVTAAIVGMRHSAQLEEILPAGDEELSQEDIQ